MKNGISFGGFLGLALLAYVGYRVFLYEPKYCTDEGVKSTLSKMLEENAIGTELKLSGISTEKKDGNRTFCEADFAFNRKLGGDVKLSSVHYTTLPTDESNGLNVQISGEDVGRLRAGM